MAEFGLHAWRTPEEEPLDTSFQANGYSVDVFCSDGFDKGASRYRFNPKSGAWSLLGRHVEYRISKVAQCGNGYLVQESQSNSDGMFTWIVSYESESEKVLFEILRSPRFAVRFA